ncbi:MAG: hypothetical protein NT089_00710 [Planctomycetia bacterium]|nr:hypothetical protein [Planctomycetia bacterium]
MKAPSCTAGGSDHVWADYPLLGCLVVAQFVTPNDSLGDSLAPTAGDWLLTKNMWQL